MACHAVHSWTVSLFMASFLKLTLAFLLLWVAWVSFVTAKFLSFFGLHLPCTCNDFIEDQNSGVENICVQASLINELPGGSDAYATSKEKIELSSEDWCQLERTLSLIDLDGLVNSGEERGEQGDLLKALDSAREQISQGDKQDVLKDIIEALGAERKARKALYLELEKERNAAKTAAEETMAMISRLQKEKASIEMEARQFKRMAEEKLVYDEEAIEILKEILVRREVDMYRQRLLRDGTDKWERKSCNERIWLAMQFILGRFLCSLAGHLIDLQLAERFSPVILATGIQLVLKTGDR